MDILFFVDYCFDNKIDSLTKKEIFNIIKKNLGLTNYYKINILFDKLKNGNILILDDYSETTYHFNKKKIFVKKKIYELDFN